MCPFSMPNASSITFKTGTMALVVQDAAEKIFSSAACCSWLTPNTIFGTPPPGAVNKTLATPFAFK